MLTPREHCNLLNAQLQDPISSSQDQIHFRVVVLEVIFFCFLLLHQCYLWRHCQTAFVAFASCWQLWRLLPGPAVRESRFSTNQADDVSCSKSDLFCSDSVWVCSDFAPDLLFCSSVPGVRVLREPTVPPQWLAAFCSSALRSPWPPVITRTLPTRLKNSSVLFEANVGDVLACPLFFPSLIIVLSVSSHGPRCQMMSRNAGTATGGRNHPLLLRPGKNHSGHLLYAFHDPVSLHFKGILWILLNKGGWTKKAQVLSTWISLRRTSINFLSRSYHGVWAQGKRRGLSLSLSPCDSYLSVGRNIFNISSERTER